MAIDKTKTRKAYRKPRTKRAAAVAPRRGSIVWGEEAPTIAVTGRHIPQLYNIAAREWTKTHAPQIREALEAQGVPENTIFAILQDYSQLLKYEARPLSVTLAQAQSLANVFGSLDPETLDPVALPFLVDVYGCIVELADRLETSGVYAVSGDFKGLQTQVAAITLREREGYFQDFTANVYMEEAARLYHYVVFLAIMEKITPKEKARQLQYTTPPQHLQQDPEAIKAAQHLAHKLAEDMTAAPDPEHGMKRARVSLSANLPIAADLVIKREDNRGKIIENAIEAIAPGSLLVRGLEGSRDVLISRSISKTDTGVSVPILKGGSIQNVEITAGDLRNFLYAIPDLPRGENKIMHIGEDDVDYMRVVATNSKLARIVHQGEHNPNGDQLDKIEAIKQLLTRDLKFYIGDGLRIDVNSGKAYKLFYPLMIEGGTRVYLDSGETATELYILSRLHHKGQRVTKQQRIVSHDLTLFEDSYNTFRARYKRQSRIMSEFFKIITKQDNLGEDVILSMIAKNPDDLKKHRGRIVQTVRNLFENAREDGILRTYSYNEATRVYSWIT